MRHRRLLLGQKDILFCNRRRRSERLAVLRYEKAAIDGNDVENWSLSCEGIQFCVWTLMEKAERACEPTALLRRKCDVLANA
jgi:hypothetical protein